MVGASYGARIVADSESSEGVRRIQGRMVFADSCCFFFNSKCTNGNPMNQAMQHTSIKDLRGPNAGGRER